MILLKSTINPPPRLLLVRRIFVVTITVFLLLSYCVGVLQAQEEETVTSSSSPNTASSSNIQWTVIQWLRSKEGGYFNEKIGLEDQSGAGGMFALQDIVRGEHLMTIPPSALLMGEEPDHPEEEDEDPYGMFGHHGDSCLTAKRLVKEYAVLGESKSNYWPYVQYVFESFAHETVPMGWSPQGKQLIHDIVGENLEPENFGSGSFVDSCGGDDDEEEGSGWEENELLDDDTSIDPKKQHELLEAAWRIVEARGWYHVMVPVLDMVNHRNGKWLNVDRDHQEGNADLHVEGDYKVVALRDIPKGTPLHNSYNQCHDETCWDIDKVYLTAGVFADYGFVEQYPRRFTFHTGYEKEDPEKDSDDYYGEEDFDQVGLGLLIEIDVVEQEEDEEGDGNSNDNNNNNNNQQQQLGIKWLNGEPNSYQIAWLERERERLRNLNVEERSKELTNHHEANMSMEYYNALLIAMDLAIKAAPTPPAPTPPKEGEEEEASSEEKSEL